MKQDHPITSEYGPFIMEKFTFSPFLILTSTALEVDVGSFESFASISIIKATMLHQSIANYDASVPITTIYILKSDLITRLVIGRSKTIKRSVCATPRKLTIEEVW